MATTSAPRRTPYRATGFAGGAVTSLALLVGLLAGCRASADLPGGARAYPRLAGFPSAAYFYDGPDAPPLVSAHRGQPELDGYPENALTSLDRLARAGSFVLELDVAMSRDSALLLFHDDRLDRLTSQSGRVAERDWADLDTMRLRDRAGRLTESTIPSLAEALAVARGRALVTLDRKRGVSYARLSRAVREADVADQVALILYDEDDLREWAGLAEVGPVSFGGDSERDLERARETVDELDACAGSSANRRRGPVPLLAFVGVGPPDPAVLAKAHHLGMRTIAGTFGPLDDAADDDDGATYRRLVAEGVDVIATNRPLAAYRALAGRYYR